MKKILFLSLVSAIFVELDPAVAKGGSGNNPSKKDDSRVQGKAKAKGQSKKDAEMDAILAAYEKQQAKDAKAKDKEKEQPKAKIKHKDMTDYQYIRNCIQNSSSVSCSKEAAITKIKTLPLQILNLQTEERVSLLFAGIVQNEFSIAQALIDAGASMQQQEMFIAETPLQIFCFLNNKDAVSFLLKNKADVNFAYNNKPPIFSAIEIGSYEIVKLLLQHQVNSNIEIKRYGFPLFYAVYVENHIAQEIKADKNKFAYQELSNRQNHYVETIKLLCSDHNTNINMQDSQGMTALMFSVKEQRKNIVNILLDAGANPNFKTEKGITALMYSVLDLSGEITRDLLRHGARPDDQDDNLESALIHAVRLHNVNSVQALLNFFVDIDIQNDLKQTALMLAVNDLDYQLVKILLKAECDINLRDDEQFTPFMKATYIKMKREIQNEVDSNVEEVIKLLQEHGAINTDQDIFLILQKLSFFDFTKDYLDSTAMSKPVATEEESVDNQRAQAVKKIIDQELLARKQIEDLAELEQQESFRRARLELYSTKKRKNYLAKLKQDQSDEAKSIGQDAKQSSPNIKKTIIDMLRENKGVDEYFRKEAISYLNNLVSEKKINVLIMSKDELKFSFKNRLENLNIEYATFDWSHIFNIKVALKYDFKSKLWQPSFDGGHKKEVIESLISSGIVRLVQKNVWANGCIDYRLENTWTRELFNKTVFPDNWNIEKIYTALCNGIVQDQLTANDLFNNMSLYGRAIEKIILHDNVYIKVVYASGLYETKIITAYPVQVASNAKTAKGLEAKYQRTLYPALPSDDFYPGAPARAS